MCKSFLNDYTPFTMGTIHSFFFKVLNKVCLLLRRVLNYNKKHNKQYLFNIWSIILTIGFCMYVCICSNTPIKKKKVKLKSKNQKIFYFPL